MFTVTLGLVDQAPLIIELNKKPDPEVTSLKRIIKSNINRLDLSNEDKALYLSYVNTITPESLTNYNSLTELRLPIKSITKATKPTEPIDKVELPANYEELDIENLFEYQGELIKQLNQVLKQIAVWVEFKKDSLNQLKHSLDEQELLLVRLLENPLGTPEGLKDLFGIDVDQSALDTIRRLLATE